MRRSIFLFLLALLGACSMRDLARQADNACTPAPKLRLNKTDQQVVGKALATKIGRRRVLDLADFCALSARLDRRYSVLQFYDEVGGNHVSTTWFVTDGRRVAFIDLEDEEILAGSSRVAQKTTLAAHPFGADKRELSTALASYFADVATRMRQTRGK